MDNPITDAESSSEAPQSFDPIDSSSDNTLSSAERWAEVSFSTEGISATLYELDENGDPFVADETWLTRDELVNALAEDRTITLD